MTPVRTVLYGTLAAVVVIVAAWMFLIYRPRGDEIADVEQQLTEAENLESSLQAQVSRLQELDEERPSVEAELRQLTAAVPPDPELATLILTLHEEASRSGIDFLQLTPSPPTAGEEVAVISAGVEVEGSFFTVLDFLDRVESLNRIVVVDSLELNAQEPDIEEDEEPQQQEEPPAESTSVAAAGGGEAAVAASEMVTIATEFGDVTTDSASLATQDDEPDDADDVGAALVDPEPVRFPVGAFTVRMTLQVRTFTTALPAGAQAGDGATTTTTAPAGGAG